MRGSVWTFKGAPDDLLARYDAMLAEFPVEQMIAHVALRTADGFLVVDTCPTEELFRSFIAGEWFAELRAKHGLPAPTHIDDYPVHVVIADGKRLEAAVA